MVSANVHAFRSYPDDCKPQAVKAWENRKHVLHAPGQPDEYEVKFNSGNNMLPPLEMKAAG